MDGMFRMSIGGWRGACLHRRATRLYDARVVGVTLPRAHVVSEI